MTLKRDRRRDAARWLDDHLERSHDSGACILWPFSKNHAGYGRIRRNGRSVSVTQIVLTAFVGPAPTPKHHACHLPVVCHAPACVNPHHLRWATRSENMLDKAADGTSNRGQRSATNKLTEAQVLSIRTDARTQRAIAADYGIHQVSVSQIKLRKIWAWLENPNEGELT